MTHARSRTHTQKHRSWLSQREMLEARLLYCGCLAFDDFCCKSKTASNIRETMKKNKFWRFHMGLVGFKPVSRFSPAPVGIFSCSRLRGTQGARLYTTAQVWVPGRLRGAFSGRFTVAKSGK